MNKRLLKAIMQRTYFSNIFLKVPTDENRYIYTKQRDLYISFLRKDKKNFANLNENDITDNRKSWQTVKVFFLRKLNQKKVLY